MKKNSFARFEMTIGLNDKVELVQLIDTEKARDLIMHAIIKAGFDGASIIPVYGFYKHENGEITIENSFRIEMQCALCSLI